MAAKPFVANVAFQLDHPAALAMYCSDGRFTEAVEELLRSLGHARLDTLTLPGGPGLLNLWSAGYTEMDAASRAAGFLIRDHGIQQVVLLAHAGCGYYEARLPGRTPEQIQQRQLADLRIAARALRGVHAELRVDLYYARADGRRVIFHPVAETASQPGAPAPHPPPPQKS